METGKAKSRPRGLRRREACILDAKRLEIDLQPFRSSDAQASYLIGGVPSALPKMASICTNASMGSAAVPTARNAGVPVK